MWNADLQKQYRTFKATLTRRRNRADWQGVIDLWAEFTHYFDSRDAAWPDDWRRWERAAEDAQFALQRIGRGL